MEIPRPAWLPDIRTYRPAKVSESDILFVTAPARGAEAIKVLREKILPANPQQLAVLEVGIGYTYHAFQTPYEPYMIAAAIEQAGVPYRMDLIDNNPIVIDDVTKRSRLAFPLYANRDSLMKASWERYLTATGQTGVITQSPDCIRIDENMGEVSQLCRIASQFGFSVASIPRTFREGLENGMVSPVLADVATVNLGKPDNYDLINCTNVLYYLSEEGQQLALYNMANMLKRGGRLIVDDMQSTTRNGQPLFERLGGWLNTEKLSEVMLDVDEILAANQYQTGMELAVCLKRN